MGGSLGYGGGNYWSRIYAWLGMELCLALLITCGWQDICSDVQEEESTLEIKLPESDLAGEGVPGTALTACCGESTLGSRQLRRTAEPHRNGGPVSGASFFIKKSLSSNLFL